MFIQLYNPKIELYSAHEGTLIETATADKIAGIRTTLNESGTYTNLAQDDSGTNTGAYGISVNKLNNPSAQPNLEYDQSLVASITTIGQVDSYRFHALSGDKISITMSNSGGSYNYFNPQIDLYGVDGSLIEKVTNTSTTKLDCLINQTGIYTMLVHDSNGYQTDDYGLTLNLLAGPSVSQVTPSPTVTPTATPTSTLTATGTSTPLISNTGATVTFNVPEDFPEDFDGQLFWDYGDETIVQSNDRTTSHTYNKPGNYTFTLKLEGLETKIVESFPVVIQVQSGTDIWVIIGAVVGIAGVVVAVITYVWPRAARERKLKKPNP